LDEPCRRSNAKLECFDHHERDWLVKFIEQRVTDTRIVRLIRKWLNAGVLEDGRRTQSDLGTVHGGSISPANIHLHYAFDLWVEQWRMRHARSDVILQGSRIGVQLESPLRSMTVPAFATPASSGTRLSLRPPASGKAVVSKPIECRLCRWLCPSQRMHS
jgi:hypothetical protein